MRRSTTDLMEGRRRLASVLLSVLLASGTGCTAGGSSAAPDLRSSSKRAADELKVAAANFGQNLPTEDVSSKEAIRSYLDAVARTPAVFGGPRLVRDSTDQPRITPRVVAGLELTVVEVASNLPGGVKYPDATTQQAFERLDASREEKRLRRFKRADLEATFEDNIRILMLLSLLTDENLLRQLVPPGSSKALELAQKGFFSESGKISVPAPPVDDVDIVPWGTFSGIVTRGPTLFSTIRYEATLRGGFPV